MALEQAVHQDRKLVNGQYDGLLMLIESNKEIVPFLFPGSTVDPAAQLGLDFADAYLV